MAISSATSVPAYVPPATTQPLRSTGRDADGDNDGSKVGEVENKAATTQPKAISSTIGTRINVTA